jgi:hypothetical protein
MSDPEKQKAESRTEYQLDAEYCQERVGWHRFWLTFSDKTYKE